MSNRYHIAGIACLLLIILSSCVVNSSPLWVQKEPLDAEFYSTVVKVSKQMPNYKDKAFENALKNISMQISVVVDASVTTREMESFGLSASDFSSQIQTSSRSQLQDIELADSFESSKEYWAWYRLNKRSYHEKRQRMALNAVSIALPLLLDYDALLQKEKIDFMQAMGFLIKAMDEVSDYLDLGTIRYNDQEIHIYPELLQRLSTLASGIKLQVDPGSLQAVGGRNHDIKSSLSASFAGQNKPIVNLPLKISFERGAGELIPNIHTAADGKAEILIKRVKSFEQQQTIGVYIEKQALARLSEDALVQKTLKGLSFPSAKLYLSVRRPKIMVEYQHKDLPVQNLSLLQNRLRELELEVVEDRQNADYLLSVTMTTGQGAYIDNLSLYSALSNCQVVLSDLASSQVIGSESLQGIKATGARADLALRKSETACIKAINDELLYRLVYLNIIGF